MDAGATKNLIFSEFFVAARPYLAFPLLRGFQL
jgi:hypothetical protein